MTGPIQLTPKQRDCMRVIQDMTDASGGVAPTLSEIASQVGLMSKSNVHRLLCGLVERGYIERTHQRARAIKILHRLPPSEVVAALAQLGEVLSAAVASADGMVRIIAPREMVDAAIVAIGIKAA
ncbi:MAG TPA: helix-turn-helix domain-containing protein [Aliidongia sp.]|uniref:LexA family protein n=1 Tax=Aliidongia sp. TaxID=1914230 RepID=UPI002DDCC866|nr:helix-turn-helix domain-containing protein [Aliidongia sp.]HEV2675523.1 helix-turn-helix domain-containing protein [Aliidongia sp.]